MIGCGRVAYLSINGTPGGARISPTFRRPTSPPRSTWVGRTGGTEQDVLCLSLCTYLVCGSDRRNKELGVGTSTPFSGLRRAGCRVLAAERWPASNI